MTVGTDGSTARPARGGPSLAQAHAAPLRVAQCIDGLQRGGAEQVVKLLAQYASPLIEHHVYAFHPGPMHQVIADLGAEVTVLPRRHAGLDPSLVRRLVCQFRADRTDLVHTHVFGAGLHGRLAARLNGGMPVVATEHTTARHLRWHQRQATRFLARWSDRVVAVSQRGARSLVRDLHVPKDKVVVIRNGIDLAGLGCGIGRERARERLGLTDQKYVIGSVGRLRPEKNYGDLLTAIARLVNQGKAVRLVLIGEGDCRRSLELQAAQLGIGERVVFAGLRDDVHELLPGLDLFAMSSLWEGMPMALLEAMAAGLPCVVTAVGGVVDVVTDGVNGFLVRPRDPAALAAKIAEVMEGPGVSAAAARKARETVRERFDAREMVRSYEQVYRQAAGRIRGSGPRPAESAE